MPPRIGRSRPRTAGAALLLGLMACFCAPWAGAATVGFVEVQSQGASGVVDGLGGVSGLTLSPDGGFLYAAGASNNAVAVFQRNAATGRLVYQTVVKQGDPVGGSQVTVTGLDTPIRAVVSPDGQALYALSAYGSVAHFLRDPSTGRLTFQQAMTPYPLAQASAITVSPGGEDLYVAGVDAGINGTGILVGLGAGTGGTAPAVIATIQGGANGVADLAGVADMAFSPDGKFLYVTSAADNAVAFFARDRTTGALTYQTEYVDGQNGISGLRSPEQLAVSPDGQYLYAAGQDAEAIVVFKRDTDTGGLGFVQALADGGRDDFGNTVAGLTGAYTLALSPEGSQVYATGTSTLAVFHRNPVSGRLTVAGLLTNGQNGVDGLDTALDLAVSPDGGFLYTAATVEDKVGVFSVAAADLGVTMTSGAAAATAGQQVRYDLVVANNGPDDATHVTISDALPPGLAYVSASADQGSCAQSGDAVTCKLGTVAVGATASLTVTATMNGSASVSNAAQAAADQRDPVPGDNLGTKSLDFNTPPTAAPDSVVANPGIALTLNVLANDVDPDGDSLSLSRVDSDSARGGAVVLNRDNTVTYTAPAGSAGEQDSFTYTVSDGRGGSATATVTILVNNPPVAVDDRATTTADTPIVIYVLVNDHDPDGDSFTVAAVDNPSREGGEVTINKDGTVKYTPPAGFVGGDSFGYTITDAYGASSSATAAVTVQPGTGGGSSSGSVGASGDAGAAASSSSGGGGVFDWLSIAMSAGLWSWRRMAEPPG